MQHPERIPSVRPDEQKRILSLGNIGEGLFYIGDGRRLMAVDAQDHVSRAQASVVSGAARQYALDHRTLHVVGRLELLANIGRDVTQAEAPTWLARFGAG